VKIYNPEKGRPNHTSRKAGVRRSKKKRNVRVEKKKRGVLGGERGRNPSVRKRGKGKKDDTLAPRSTERKKPRGARQGGGFPERGRKEG